MTISVSAPLVPATPWSNGASVPYASSGVAQNLTVALSPGNGSTIVGVYLSSSPVSAGTLPAHGSPPAGAVLVGVAYAGRPTVIIPDHEARAAAHVCLSRMGPGTSAATVAVTGDKGGVGVVSAAPSAYQFGAITYSTSSASFTDVTGASATITTTVDGEVFATVDLTYSGANNLQGEMVVLVGSQQSDATPLDGTNAAEAATLSFRTTGLTAGTYTVKVQARKSGGSAALTVTHCDLYAEATKSIGGA